MKRALSYRRKSDEEKGDYKALVIILAAVFIAFLVSTFLIRIIDVVGRSMVPTLSDNDWVLIDRISYKFTEPEKNDIIVFENKDVADSLIVKRIIAVPGDTVELKNGYLYINDKLYQDEFSVRYGNFNREKFTVEDGFYFVLGDNRSESNDSLSWENPCISIDDIKGKVILKLFPKIQRIS